MSIFNLILIALISATIYGGIWYSVNSKIPYLTSGLAGVAVFAVGLTDPTMAIGYPIFGLAILVVNGFLFQFMDFKDNTTQYVAFGATIIWLLSTAGLNYLDVSDGWIVASFIACFIGPAFILPHLLNSRQ